MATKNAVWKDADLWRSTGGRGTLRGRRLLLRPRRHHRFLWSEATLIATRRPSGTAHRRRPEHSPRPSTRSHSNRAGLVRDRQSNGVLTFVPRLTARMGP